MVCLAALEFECPGGLVEAGSAQTVKTQVTVTEGTLCTAQGVFKQFGDVSVAFMSLTIAIQTFCVLVVRWHAPPSSSKYIIGTVFLFIILMIGISVATRTHSEKGAYYGNTGFWCWIGDQYKTEKIVFEYLWMWLAAFIMLIIYGIIALVMRGILVIGDESGNESRWKLRWDWSGNRGVRDRISTDDMEDDDEDEERRQARAIANLMLFYPAVYIFCVFPVGLVRWLVFSGNYVPRPATIFASIVFSLSGLLNTILYVLTRPELVRGSGEDPPEAARTKRKPELGTEKTSQPRSAANRRNLGHLPDRDDDMYLQDHSSVGADSPPWLKSQHSKSDIGYPYTASPTSAPSDNIILGHLPAASQDAYTSTTSANVGLGSRGSNANEIRQQQQWSHQKLVSLDMGHLLDLDSEHGGGQSTGQGQQLLQVPRSEGRRRGSGSSHGMSISGREASFESSATAVAPVNPIQ
ncbi:hypothetical protein Hypma_005911 [Hypsizygus marmoreus]|uniref:Glucose receptor Git3 N-terminal domain-containing protein n=1 Tax=Hypsizygus marmoreus TaxID=39966 RepID=A0A369K8B8_HYPMA|nr:hypothetical protein Hypma_005911 [Hypsizygus marmoreus]